MIKNTRKILLLLIMFATIGTYAQNDRFFNGYEHDAYGKRESETSLFIHQAFGASDEGQFTNETFGAPLGGGLLIMLLAGACYAVWRTKTIKNLKQIN